MKPVVFFILVFFCGTPIGAQSSYFFGSQGSVGIQFVPLPLVDRNPKLRLGVELRPRTSFGYSLEIGWANHAFKNMPISGEVWGIDYSAFEIRPQVKWYFLQTHRFEMYLGSEIFYRKITDRLVSNSYKNLDAYEYTSFEQADILKEKFGIHALVGSKTFITPHLFLEYYLGLGLALRNNIYSNVINPSPDPYRVREWFDYEYQLAGKKWVTQYPMGFKIGVLLK